MFVDGEWKGHNKRQWLKEENKWWWQKWHLVFFVSPVPSQEVEVAKGVMMQRENVGEISIRNLAIPSWKWIGGIQHDECSASSSKLRQMTRPHQVSSSAGLPACSTFLSASPVLFYKKPQPPVATCPLDFSPYLFNFLLQDQLQLNLDSVIQ